MKLVSIVLVVALTYVNGCGPSREAKIDAAVARHKAEALVLKRIEEQRQEIITSHVEWIGESRQAMERAVGELKNSGIIDPTVFDRLEVRHEADLADRTATLEATLAKIDAEIDMHRLLVKEAKAEVDGLQ